MSETKKKYWLKLNKDFLKSSRIKVIKNMINGRDYIIFYLSLMLESIETVGHLRYTSLVPYNAEMLAAITETNVDIVRSATKLFCELGLMQIFDDGTIFMTDVPEMTGKESESTERVRNYRERLKISEQKKQAKTNALRQKQYRAKVFCEQKQHVPYIEDSINNKRYNGNYYIVLKRDKIKCQVCGGVENLCVHHIDGYSDIKPENNCENKMITLCRNCHQKIHAGEKISEDILESIDYYYESNESNEICNAEVTKSNDNIEKEKEKEKEIKEEIKEEIKKIETKKRFNAKNSFSEFFEDTEFQKYEPFKEIFLNWIEYKSEIKNQYKTIRGLKGAFLDLIRISGENVQEAKRLVDYAISKEWKGIYTNGNCVMDKPKETESMEDWESRCM